MIGLGDSLVTHDGIIIDWAASIGKNSAKSIAYQLHAPTLDFNDFPLIARNQLRIFSGGGDSNNRTICRSRRAANSADSDGQLHRARYRRHHQRMGHCGKGKINDNFRTWIMITFTEISGHINLNTRRAPYRMKVTSPSTCRSWIWRFGSSASATSNGSATLRRSKWERKSPADESPRAKTN